MQLHMHSSSPRASTSTVEASAQARATVAGAAAEARGERMGLPALESIASMAAATATDRLNNKPILMSLQSHGLALRLLRASLSKHTATLDAIKFVLTHGDRLFRKQPGTVITRTHAGEKEERKTQRWQRSRQQAMSEC